MLDEFVINENLDFEDERLQVLIADLKKCYVNQQNNFAEICRTIYKIWSYCKTNYWKAKDNKYYNCYKFLAMFGFDKKAICRYKSCYEKFIDKSSCTVYFNFSKFSPSKLFELLSLSNETIVSAINKNFISPDMTVKEIREYVKSLKSGIPQAEKVLEDKSKEEIDEAAIPMAYDPKQEYEYSYFESKTKNQLLNIVWELQKYKQKLQNKGDKTKK